MKKILGILLALCFVLSVTAAAASATPEEHKQNSGDKDKKFGDKDRHDERENHIFNDHHKKRHHHPGHWEKKRVGHREFRNHHWETVFVYKVVYIAAYDDYHY